MSHDLSQGSFDPFPLLLQAAELKEFAEVKICLSGRCFEKSSACFLHSLPQCKSPKGSSKESFFRNISLTGGPPPRKI